MNYPIEIGTMKNYLIKYVVLSFLVMVINCAPKNDFDELNTFCDENLVANATYAQVQDLYQGELLQIQEDLVIEGYVVSSDKEGNFFSTLYFQNDSMNPTAGFQIEIDLFESHLLFKVGQKILIKTKGLYLGKKKDVFVLGGTFSGFGNTAIGRLPGLKVPQHIFRDCAGVENLIAKTIKIEEIDVYQTNTLIAIDSLQFLVDDFGKFFAEPESETERILEDCSGNQVTLLNSGFADFQSEIIYENNGKITGVLLRENNDYFIAIRDLKDLEFTNERCADLRETSNQVFFSELADPNNNASARFLELFNASEVAVDLRDWSIHRYTNNNVEISSSINLSGLKIEANSTLIITPNAAVFEQTFGFQPNLEVGKNSPADSNGDDNLVLVDPFGTVIDVFGVIGEDGTATNHEFEDGKAQRKLEVIQGNPIYNILEWNIFNDSGEAGTVNLPQNAPEDFSPGARN